MLAVLAASCVITGAQPCFRPDNACTPGSYDPLPKAQVCVHKQRPTLPAAVKREVLARYGFMSWSGKTGELDYRIPFFLGGETKVSSLWPETGPIPNRKDALERYVRDRICVKATMRVRTAVGIFLADWVTYSRRYGL
jgi:hypothetical protein